MTFDWIGEGFLYGRKLAFFQITTEGVPLVFTIHEGNELTDHPFVVQRIKKNIKSINIEHEIEEEISKIHIIQTDNVFRKKMKRSYSLLKIIAGDQIITIGAYTDNKKIMKSDNLYILCERDFINILASSELLTSSEQINGTPFEVLAPIFNKKELAKELLRE